MFLYTGSHKYVFPGAEVYYDPDDDFEEDDDKGHSSESENEDDGVAQEEESSQSCHGQASASSSSHHPRIEEDYHSTDAPHLSPDEVDSLLSAADNGQSHDHEDWTSLNASLDTSLDCDHTLPGYDTDNEHKSDNTAKVTDFSANKYSPPSDL